MNWEQFFIEQLLNKYERSKQFRDTKSQARKINYPFTTSKMQEYHFGMPQTKIEIKNAVLRLAELGMIRVIWKKGEFGNLIEEIVLQIDSLDKSYSFIDRISKKNELDSFTNLLEIHARELISLGLGKALEEWLSEISLKKKIPSLFSSNAETRKKVILALAGISTLEDDIDERMFSLSIFGNSKAFLGNIKVTVAKILKFSNGMDSDITDGEALETYGILESGSDFHIAGDIIFRFPDGCLDISAVGDGIGLHPPSVKIAEVERVNTDFMLSVENLAIFRECTRRKLYSNALIVYSGGFYSRRKIELIKRIYKALQSISPQIQFFHWGDIDLGGFRIFRHLKVSAIPVLKPFMMTPDILDRYQGLCVPVDYTYAEKMKRLIDDIQLTELKATIARAVGKMVKLEQEAVLCSRR